MSHVTTQKRTAFNEALLSKVFRSVVEEMIYVGISSKSKSWGLVVTVNLRQVTYDE